MERWDDMKFPFETNGIVIERDMHFERPLGYEGLETEEVVAYRGTGSGAVCVIYVDTAMHEDLPDVCDQWAVSRIYRVLNGELTPQMETVG